MRKKSFGFHIGWGVGIVMGFLGSLLVPRAQAQKPSQLDILHNVVMQNFYLTQKVVTYNEFERQLMLQIADRTKVKAEQFVPLTNKLQQDLFALDLKIRELNK